MKNEAARREKLAAIMERDKLDAFLVTNPVNVTYLTGFNGEDSFLWFGDGGPALLSDSRFEEQIKEECPEIPAFIRVSGETTFGLIEKAASDSRFSSAKPKRVAIESEATTVAFYQALLKAFPEVEFVPLPDEVEKLREIKDADEIAAIRAAIDVSIDAYRKLRETLQPDATEVDLRDELDYQMRKFGGDDVGFPTIIAFDARAALPHAIPQRGRKICDASLVLIDWGAKKGGYVGDLTRTFRTEKGLAPDNAEFERRFRKVFEAVQTAHDAAIAAMKPGAICSTIDKIARKAIADAGFGEYFSHGLGHGIGRVVHDYGGLNPRAGAELRPGMILTVEPGIYLPGWGGVRLEDDVLITESGCEILSSRLPLDDILF
ncbi:MAG: aminopeptidase P family protein [Thermoguttaceae bacterium]|nr:aminopeptidase P family protein [Thermoguttaceae bacterium]